MCEVYYVQQGTLDVDHVYARKTTYIQYISNVDHEYPLYYMYNKAVRDGKYLAPPRVSAWQLNVHPITIENIFSWRHFCAPSSLYIFNW